MVRRYRSLNPKYFVYLITFVVTCLIFFKSGNDILRTDYLSRYNINSYSRERTYYFPFSSRFKMPKYSYKRLDDNSIPDSGRVVEEHIMHFNLNYLSRKDIVNTNKVLILTLMETYNDEYWNNLLNLTFEKQSIEIGLMVLPTEEGDTVLKQLEKKITQIQGQKEDGIFKKITILRASDVPEQIPIDADETVIELNKRKYMASLRNELYVSTIGPETRYVLWLGSEIIGTPPSLVEDLISVDKPVVTTNIQIQNKDNTVSYEYENSKSWIENVNWYNKLQGYPQNSVFMEGIGGIATERIRINHLMDVTARIENLLKTVEMDSVSVECTLIQSDVHRDGAMFPTFPFYHMIETEGFAKMVKRLQYEVYGLPNYLVYHS
ncbi:Golgi mannosyltransferase complex subunit [Maudiozyma exigua]|uniref:Golgi mannosyltransferase complex subunit n=1 Tax=Maudiozyma exigua TaxID=34358 RepID=A0A9P6WE28_MAUEX|nr:Golgi mannosyltransferase complex subunit [Kazachstania exigua]